MAGNRMIGAYPIIGIRPVIDARRGILDVRGSLEEQTMGMAEAARELLASNIRYSNGDPVQVVIADGTIGRVAEAAACAEKFKKMGVDITLSVTPCWCYGSETMDMDPRTIKGVWGFNATERPGAVYLASVLAAHAQKGIPAFGIYGSAGCARCVHTGRCQREDPEICKGRGSCVHHARQVLSSDWLYLHGNRRLQH